MKIRKLLLPVALMLVLASCGESPEAPGNNMTITVIQPPAGSVQADSSYTIVWETTNVVAGATVTLAYDTDTNPSVGRTLIESDLDNSGTYLWDSKFVPEGVYYVYALISSGTSSASDYSEGTITFEHPWADPKITVRTPPVEGAEADSVFTIKWATEYFKNPQINLYFETDTTLVDTVGIVKGLDDTGSYEWDCSAIGTGQYYIYAVATESSGGHDQEGSAAVISAPLSIGGSRDDSVAVDHSPGTLIINHGGSLPQITVLTPPKEGATADTSFLIRWTEVSLGDVLVDLYYDTDTVPGTGLVQIVAGLSDTLSYNWDCSAITDGKYYIFGEVKDVSGRLLGDFRATGTDYSDGILAIDHTSGFTFRITEPGAGGAIADSTYTIRWMTDVPGSEFVDLFYSADTLGGELFLVVDDAPNTTKYTWDCSAVLEGNWWIFGIIEMASDTLESWSPGALTVEHNAFSMEVTAPPDTGATADSSYTIEWIAQGPDSAVVDLYYDTDKDPVMMDEIVLGLDNTGSYEWDMLYMLEGEFYIYAHIRNPSTGIGFLTRLGADAGAAAYSDSTLTIDHEGVYDLEITQPPLAGADADTVYTIEWTSDAPDSLELNLFYAADTVGATAVEVALGVPNSGSYEWDCSLTPEGDWYIYGALVGVDEPTDWSAGQLSIIHVPYTMEVTAPPAGGASADSSYTIEWTATGGASAVVDLFYDDDDDPAEMTEIVSGLSNTGSYEWNTLSVSEGDWYVYALIHPSADGARSAGDYSDGTLSVTHASYYILVTRPPAGGGAFADSTYKLQWAASAPGGSTVDLYYDTDTNPGSGLVSIVSDLTWDDFNYTWRCSAVVEGEYYVYAELFDGSTTVTDYSDSTLIIDHDPLFLWISKPGPGGATADTTYTIAWVSKGPKYRVIDLYYDTDTNPDNGIELIAEDVASTEPTSDYKWGCVAIPEGSYYIFGVLWDSVAGGDSTSHYSEGLLTIDHI